MRVLVCGGRDYTEREALYAALDAIHDETPITTIIHGGARGADSLAHDWARYRRVFQDVYPADWNTHGKAAGPIRNAQMLSEGKPDLVIAFRGGRGTANMVAQAERAGVPVKKVGW